MATPVTDERKLRIVSDGTTHGTKIIAPDGQVLGFAQELHIDAKCGEAFLTAQVKFIMPLLDIEVLESSFSDNRADCQNCNAECENRGMDYKER